MMYTVPKKAKRVRPPEIRPTNAQLRLFEKRAAKGEQQRLEWFFLEHTPVLSYAAKEIQQSVRRNTHRRRKPWFITPLQNVRFYFSSHIAAMIAAEHFAEYGRWGKK